MEASSTRLRLRVVPSSRREGLAGRYGEAWKLRVAAPPARGAANAAVRALLARLLAVPEQAITLVSGHRGRDKIVVVTGITPIETERRLASAERKESVR